MGSPILALDVPSGLDVDGGGRSTLSVQATATMMLALPKPALLAEPATGELYLADISVPQGVYRRVGLSVPSVFGLHRGRRDVRG